MRQCGAKKCSSADDLSGRTLGIVDSMILVNKEARAGMGPSAALICRINQL